MFIIYTPVTYKSQIYRSLSWSVVRFMWRCLNTFEYKSPAGWFNKRTCSKYQSLGFNRFVWPCLFVMKYFRDSNRMTLIDGINRWMNRSCATPLQTCTVNRPAVCPGSQCPTHIVCICRGFCFHASPGLKAPPQGTAHCNQAWFYGSQSAIQRRLRLMTPVLTDWHWERGTAVRHAPHTHKSPSIWWQTNKEMCP